MSPLIYLDFPKGPQKRFVKTLVQGEKNFKCTKYTNRH